MPSLRGVRSFGVVRAALAAGSARGAFRLIHFTVQSNHLHLIVEAKDRPALSRGAQGLCVRIAKAVNRLWRRCGPVFADRYHEHVLRTPREVRHALAHVLNNARRHGARFGGVDPCSSGSWFDGWRGRALDEPGTGWQSARTWLLSVGWRRHGLIPLPDG
jgi:hypothetical protein